MKKNYFLERVSAMLMLFSFASIFNLGYSQMTQNFDDITTLAGAGWVMQNNSVPIGSTNWFQGNPAAFNAFNGATNSYIGANFNNVAGAATISNWLVTPNFTLKNGDVFTFYTRTSSDNMWADRLQVRMSTNGASTNVGTGSAAVGDFTTLLLDINPTLSLSVYPMVWTQYTIVISGLSAPTSGRLAFRYFVDNGGPSGTNSDYIGIDNFVYTPYVCPTLTVTPASLPNATAGAAYTQNLSQTGALGTPTYTVTAGSLPPGLILSPSGSFSGSPSGTGTFNFTVTVSDASGCTGSTAYTLTVDCPTNGASLAAFPNMCSNDSPLLLTQGSPSGGTYSGTGVTGSLFDPAAGTQLITYSLTDIYGCPQSADATITVNTAPTVTLSPFTSVCSNDGSIALSGGSPVGGDYSGTGVSGGNFDPSAGSQSITYTFTDGNGCSNEASQIITVNTAPSVTLDPFTFVCSGTGEFALSGGLPSGGVYSGTGVTAGNFNPSTEGTFPITYTFTDGNNCSGSAIQNITVVNCLGIDDDANADLNFVCYPNPAEDQLNIEFFQNQNDSYQIRLINIEGKTIFTEFKSGNAGANYLSLNLSHLETGIYFIELNTINGIVTKKIIVK